MMARKYLVPVWMSKRLGEQLARVLESDGLSKLAWTVSSEIDSQVGRSFLMELPRKDAVAMHTAALNSIQLGDGRLASRAYGKIEAAFLEGYALRLRAVSGE